MLDYGSFYEFLTIDRKRIVYKFPTFLFSLGTSLYHEYGFLETGQFQQSRISL